MAEHLVVGVEITHGKYLLGSAYHLMHQVAAQLLKNEAVHTISIPWWLSMRDPQDTPQGREKI